MGRGRAAAWRGPSAAGGPSRASPPCGTCASPPSPPPVRAGSTPLAAPPAERSGPRSRTAAVPPPPAEQGGLFQRRRRRVLDGPCGVRREAGADAGGRTELGSMDSDVGCGGGCWAAAATVTAAAAAGDGECILTRAPRSRVPPALESAVLPVPGRAGGGREAAREGKKEKELVKESRSNPSLNSHTCDARMAIP